MGGDSRETIRTCLCTSRSAGVGTIPTEYHPKNSKVGKTCLT